MLQTANSGLFEFVRRDNGNFPVFYITREAQYYGEPQDIARDLLGVQSGIRV